MTKKAINVKMAGRASTAAEALASGAPTTAQAQEAKGSSPSQFSRGVLAEAGQIFSSEEQALSFLLNSVTEKLGDVGLESSQLHEFLSLVLESDPQLREQILSGVSIRK
jgi:hypothetical protein